MVHDKANVFHIQENKDHHMIWLMVSIPLKNITQLGWLFPICEKKCSKPPTSDIIYTYPYPPVTEMQSQLSNLQTRQEEGVVTTIVSPYKAWYNAGEAARKLHKNHEQI